MPDPFRRPPMVDIPPEPPVGTVLETSDDIDTYRIERTDLGWHIQYREGESEFGERLTSFAGRGISWRAAWSAWGPPAGSRPFYTVPAGAPPLPPRPPEPDPYAGMSADASAGHLDPPPAAQPYQPPKCTAQSTTKPPGTSYSGGTTMSGSDTYGGLRARVQGVASRMQERQGLLQQALSDIEQDVAEVNDIGSETNQAGIQDSLGALQQVQQKIEEAIQMLGAAEQSLEGAAAALS